MENEECRNCWEIHPSPRHSSCCVKGSRSKNKGDRFMTYDPLRCLTCQAFIAESGKGVAAAQAELRKLFSTIRGHRQRSRCPNTELMNFFSSEEDTNRLLNLAHYVPSSSHAHSSTNPLSQLTSSSQDESSLQPHYIEQQSSLTALPSTSLQGPSSGPNTITMKVFESATQADTLRQAVASILSHPSPKPLAEEQSSTPRRDGSSPHKRPRSHTTYEEDSATLAPAKEQRQDATLNDISSLLLQFAQCFDKLESDMAIVKGSNSHLLQDREKGKSFLPFSSSSSSPSEGKEDDLPPVAQSASSLNHCLLPNRHPAHLPIRPLPTQQLALCHLHHFTCQHPYLILPRDLARSDAYQLLPQLYNIQLR
ncbi:hypothetical protein Pcinc_016537 [Petrolisthes cinctipes]|uniref:Uncharacterized protein n=1 Tax=Petrolisthes cinctipes TaxID=88211 RepID=A0AAE1FQW5_PETCI|nr:hypothetical protein Pcinc_016537 [Petrolisthes cinctipes]